LETVFIFKKMTKQREKELISVDTVKTDAQIDEPRKPLFWIRLLSPFWTSVSGSVIILHGSGYFHQEALMNKSRSLIRSRIRIRIRMSVVQIRGSGPETVPKCHGSATLVETLGMQRKNPPFLRMENNKEINHEYCSCTLCMQKIVALHFPKVRLPTSKLDL
jgi:hypothetical protein